MAADTSPSVTALKNGSWEVGFQASTRELWTVGADNHGSWHSGLLPGTNPALAAVGLNSYHLDIPRLDLSSGLGDFLFGPVAPGDVLVVGAVVVEAAVEDSNEAVAEGA
jgi:hypothetical protein